MASPRLTYRQILTFWLPLAGTWLMMAVEGPYLAAFIARLPQPAENLAAFGVTFAFALIIESPVIMLMSASTALVKDHETYLAFRRFAYGLSAILTIVLLLLVLPPIFQLVSFNLLKLPKDVGTLTHGGLILLLPWPAAIGYRRFQQGLLIRYNLTRRVAYGTILRLIAMTLTAMTAAHIFKLGGIYVATVALSAGVLVEALASRLMSRSVVRQLAKTEHVGTGNDELTLSKILAFYVPLALTSFLAMAVQPLVTFFMAQSRLALESLAALPVIHGLTFIFRSLGLSYQEVGIAMLGDSREHYKPLRNFSFALALFTSTTLGIIAFSRLSTLWFHEVSNLSVELTHISLLPTQIFTLLPALTVLLSFQRSLLVHSRDTAPITQATAIEVVCVFGILTIGIHGLDLPGVVAAALATVLGRMLANLWLIRPCQKALRPRLNELA